MPDKVYLSQRTARQIIKRIDSASKLYETHFGIYGTVKTDNTGLNFPWMVTKDPAGNVYGCDGNNQRVMKFNKHLAYTANVDVSSEIGRPFAIFYDSISTDLYVAGIKNYLTISIARITTALVVSKFNSNVYTVGINEWPMGISSDFTLGYFLISGLSNVLKVQETGGGFNTAATQAISEGIGVTASTFLGHTRHSNGDLYFNAKRVDGSRIARVDSSYRNIGDSNKIGKLGYYISEGSGGSLLVFNVDNYSVLRYDQYMNFVETIYQDNPVAPGVFVVTPPANFIDFDHGLGPQPSMPIAPGIYPNATALALAIKIALDTSLPPTPNIYTVTYGTVVPNSFEIIQDPGGLGIFSLFLATMPVSGLPASIGPLIGFTVDMIQPAPGIPPGVPPGPPWVGNIPVFGSTIANDGKEVYGMIEQNV